MSKILEFKNMALKVKGQTKFENFNLVINKGDRLSFIGNNGGGKTTILELIMHGITNNFNRDFSKDIKVNDDAEIINWSGHNILRNRPDNVNKKIAYVPQKYKFSKNATVLSEVTTECNAKGVDFDEDELDLYLKKFGIFQIKNNKASSLSGGESRIVLLIRALMVLDYTKILILDEPLNHLSFKNSKVLNDIILDKLKERDDLTILMVSHCKALSFIEKSIIFNKDHNTFILADYKSYDCFDDYVN